MTTPTDRDELGRAADALSGEIVGWRRDLHRHPELGFEERRTAAFVEERLRGLGLEEIRTGVAVTGVVGVIRARTRSVGAVLLRADMDALPIQEVPGRDHGSRIDGRMHACGHDGHTAMLLGAATLLVSQREALRRDVVLCFQPGEEGMGGGRRMIDEGVLEAAAVERVFGLHLWSPFPAGTLHVRAGATMAAQDEFTARIHGHGGHGALPHQARDPIVAAAQAVMALQAVVSRSIDPVQPAVVTVGSLHAGSAPNVIPGEAVFEGTLRSFDETVRATIRRRVVSIVESTAAAADCRGEVELRPGYPAVINDEAAVADVRRIARTVFGDKGVVEPAPLAAAEDFAYFLAERPGAFAFLGAGNVERGITAPHHSPAFEIDESVLSRGAELLARLALD